MNKSIRNLLLKGTLGAMMLTTCLPSAYLKAEASVDLNKLYGDSFKATITAQQTKDQKDITTARGLVDEFYETVKNDKVLINNARTMSSWLDVEQQEKFNYIIALCVDRTLEGTQANINQGKYIFFNLPQKWQEVFNAYSTAIDPLQQNLINEATIAVDNANKAIDKANGSKLQADIDGAKALLATAQKSLEELKTALDSNVVEWAKLKEKELKQLNEQPEVEDDFEVEDIV